MAKFGNMEMEGAYKRSHPGAMPKMDKMGISKSDGEQPDSESQAGEDFKPVMDEHGMAHETRIERKEDGSHTVHSHHEDGHHHASHGHDVHSAHKHSMMAHTGEEQGDSEERMPEEEPESLPTMKG